MSIHMWIHLSVHRYCMLTWLVLATMIIAGRCLEAVYCRQDSSGQWVLQVRHRHRWTCAGHVYTHVYTHVCTPVYTRVYTCLYTCLCNCLYPCVSCVSAPGGAIGGLLFIDIEVAAAYQRHHWSCCRCNRPAVAAVETTGSDREDRAVGSRLRTEPLRKLLCVLPRALVVVLPAPAFCTGRFPCGHRGAVTTDML